MWVCATPATWNDSRCEFVPRLPRKTTVGVSLCHACHAKCRGVTGAQASPSAPPSAMSATPATETTVGVSLCHACHAKCRGVTGAQASPSTPPSAMSATPATQNDGGCEFVPRLPRETKVDVRLCHACHAKWRGVTGAQASPSAPPNAICTTPATQNDGGCEFVPRLPRKTTASVSLCHACHAKCRGVTGAQASPSAPPSAMSATPATQNDRWMWVCATPATWNEGGCQVVPRLPRKVARRHGRPSQSKRATQCHECHACHAKRRWMWDCATPATWNEGGCEVVPRLPRKVARRHGRPSQSKRATQCHLYHACHAKRRWMWVCATPATQNDSKCEFVPRLPRKVPRRHGRPSQSKRATQCHECHACHAKRRWMWVCATPATWNEGGCQVVPRLPRKVARRHGRPSQSKHATQCHECHACHAKRRWMWDCATPATWNEGGCEVVPRLPRKVARRHGRPSQSKRATQCHLYHACHAKRRWMWVCATPATQKRRRMWDCRVSVCVWSLCVWSYCMLRNVVCAKVLYVKLLYVKFVCVKLLYVRDSMWQSCVYVTKLCVCVGKYCMWSLWYCMWNYCMLSLCVWSYCMWEIVCDKVVCMWQSCVCVWESVVCEVCVCVKLLYVKDKVVCVWESIVC